MTAANVQRCVHGYPVNPNDPTVQECIDRHAPAARKEQWARLIAATVALGVAWAELQLALDAYRRAME